MRSAEDAACPRDWIPCVPRSVIITVGSVAGGAAPAIGGLTAIDNMSAPAAIDERRRNLLETVIVNSTMRVAHHSAHRTTVVPAITARSSTHVKHVTHQRAFPLESGEAAVCLRRDPNCP